MIGVLIIIVIVFIVLLSIAYGVYRALKKINKDKKSEAEILQEEFDRGDVIVPVDRRDFEDLDKFQEKTAHIPSISKKLASLDEDFKKRNFNTGEKDGDKNGGK